MPPALALVPSVSAPEPTPQPTPEPAKSLLAPSDAHAPNGAYPALKNLPPKVHAARLLEWLKTDGNTDSKTYGRAYTIYGCDNVKLAYADMCIELQWAMRDWIIVARHFNKLTGGKKYDNAVDPATGKKTRKVRVYRIPGLGSKRRVKSAAERMPPWPELPDRRAVADMAVAA